MESTFLTHRVLLVLISTIRYIRYRREIHVSSMTEILYTRKLKMFIILVYLCRDTARLFSKKQMQVFTVAKIVNISFAVIAKGQGTY